MQVRQASLAFTASFIAGFLMILGSLAMAGMLDSGSWWMGTCDGKYVMLGLFELSSDTMYLLIGLGGACGVLVLLSAVIMYRTPYEASIWGILIIIFSLLSLIGMGGFYIGAFLGMGGGMLALRPLRSGQRR